mmetsp:Transcript_6347/g.20033  ORF Transcript_6347/g.20033 Transcript_6347/m.20033 type:complete len:251 (-) Transcript_6347:804-1556(-)
MLFLRVLVALGARIPVLLYRDRFCAVNKPPGISTHRSRETGRRRVVTTHLQRQLRRKVYTVHRLDHRTSGALLFGFDGEAAGECHARLRAGRKEYLALLRGCDWPNDDGADVVVDRDVKGDDGVPRAALTTFRRLASQEEPRCTLCIASPATGRPHQIRRHAQSLSMPIVGDSAHGDSKVNRWWREERGLDRLALHCLAITLPDPETPIVAPIEGSLADVLRSEPLWADALAREPRLRLAPVDDRSGSNG